MREWTQYGACHKYPTEMFFPDRKNDACIPFAKRICKDCPVKAPCLGEALAYGDEAKGIWGGTTEEERFLMKVILGPNLPHQFSTLANNA